MAKQSKPTFKPGPKVTNCGTAWWDRELQVWIDVPPGESVKVVALNDIPADQGQHLIRRSIEIYAQRAILPRKCVPIKIRDWYALIDGHMLSDEYCVLEVDSLGKTKVLL